MSEMTPRNFPFPANEDWWAWPLRSRILDQHFGLGLLNDPFYRMPAAVFPYYMMRSGNSLYGNNFGQGSAGFADVANEKDKFSVKMDVSHFKPEEITVKTVDNCLIVEANHKERRDEHGFIKRSFTRRYLLPHSADISTLTSSWNHRNSVLTIEARKKMENDQNRLMPVQLMPSGGRSLKAEMGGSRK